VGYFSKLVLLGVFSSAVSAAADELNEIVVTAQHRVQNIQDVGIAIDAFSGETLSNLGVVESTDIARLTPGVSISASNGGQDSQFSIRGVTQNDFSDATEAPVAVYVDDSYIPNLNGQIFSTFDLDRVEILKGPQGTLFGRNATGGVVQFVPKKPTDEANGYLDVEYGSYNQERVEAGIGLPISDKVQMRLSGLFNQFNPILRNIYPYGVDPTAPGGTPPPHCCQNLWNDHTIAGRAQFQLEPSDQLTLRLTASAANEIYSSDPYNSAAVIGVFNAQGELIDTRYTSPTETRTNIGPGGINVDNSGAPTSATRPVPGGDQLGYVAPSARSLKISDDWASGNLNYLKAYDTALHLDYLTDSFALASISGYRVFRKYNGTDIDSGPVNFLDYATDSEIKSFSQELRLSGDDKKPIRWLAGAFFLMIDRTVHDGFPLPTSSLLAGAIGFGSTGIDLINDIYFKTNSISGFGQVEYDFAPTWTFVLGGRLVDERQNYVFDSGAHANVDNYKLNFASPTLFTLQPAFSDRRSEVLWAGKAQIEHRPTKDLLLYFGVNRGVKAGGFNALAPSGATLAPDQIPYKPEVLLSYEGGVKSTLADGKVTLNGSIYYYDYTDYQTFTFLNAQGTISNNAARFYGVELSVLAAPTRNLHLAAGVSQIHARVDNLAIAPGVFADVQPTFTPATQIAGQLSYTMPVRIAGGTVSIVGDASWRTKQYANIHNFNADAIGSYALTNVRLKWLDSQSHYQVTVGLDNAFDRRYLTTSYDLPTLCGCQEVSYGKPRWWTAQFRYSY
jgi:iron complex outermembrane receptor protein